MSIRSLARGVSAVYIVTFLLTFVGCATMFNGTKQDVLITSTSNQAEVVVKNSEEIEVFRGITPAIVKIPRKGTYSISVSLPGYKEQKTHISDQKFVVPQFGGLDFDSSPSANGCKTCGEARDYVGIIRDIVSNAWKTWKKPSPDHIAINLVTAPSDQNTGETYAVFHGRDDGDMKTLTVPLIRQ